MRTRMRGRSMRFGHSFGVVKWVEPLGTGSCPLGLKAMRVDALRSRGHRRNWACRLGFPGVRSSPAIGGTLAFVSQASAWYVRAHWIAISQMSPRFNHSSANAECRGIRKYQSRSTRCRSIASPTINKSAVLRRDRRRPISPIHARSGRFGHINRNRGRHIGLHTT